MKKVLTTVLCRKPNRQEFVRVRAGEEWRLETGLFEDRVNREMYPSTAPYGPSSQEKFFRRAFS